MAALRQPSPSAQVSVRKSTAKAPTGNAVKHIVAAGRKPSGVSRIIKNRRACALPLQYAIFRVKNASQRCPFGAAEVQTGAGVHALIRIGLDNES